MPDLDPLFKTRGPLTKEDASLYIERPADASLAALVQQIDYVALIGARNSGKTSMLLRLWENLVDLPRYVLCYVNLSRYSTLDETRWYKEMYSAMIESSKGSLPAPAVSIADAIDLREALVDGLRDTLKERILIILLDDIESVPQEISTSFFATLREMYVSRGVEPALKRLSFVLAGSYIPDELITDSSISPFRVAEKVYIDDATDVTPLVRHLNHPERSIARDVPARVQEWTEGDLYLTQRLCKKLHEHYPDGQITPIHVDQIVERDLRDDDIFSGLEKKLTAQARVLELVRQVALQETVVRFTRTNRAISQAWLLGCIKMNPYGNCICRNSIYDNALREVFKNLPAAPLKARSLSAQEAEPLQGRFQLDGVIKRGTLNNIYRARDLTTGEIVAVKQLLVGRGSDILVWRRFQREAETLKQLNHPHIVRLIDSFRGGEYNYIVMEYVGGGTADALLSREGRQPIPLLMDIILPVANALAYVHEHDIVHRDLKPSNILLTPELKPRLADFGVAHFQAAADRITETYVIVGTPAYLSPEGYQSSLATPGEDVWAMGVTLYELLTGVLPFTGRTHDHVRHAVQHDPIPDIRQIRPDIPEALGQVIKQMLQRDPKQRLPNGRAVLDALQQVRAVLD